MNDQDEWDAIRHRFDIYISHLTYSAVECTAHFLGVGENEMGFKYLMLFLFEGPTVLADSDRTLAMAVAQRLKMERNEWTDIDFWSKFTELLNRR